MIERELFAKKLSDAAKHGMYYHILEFILLKYRLLLTISYKPVFVKLLAQVFNCMKILVFEAKPMVR